MKERCGEAEPEAHALGVAETRGEAVPEGVPGMLVVAQAVAGLLGVAAPLALACAEGVREGEGLEEVLALLLPVAVTEEEADAARAQEAEGALLRVGGSTEALARCVRL